MLPTLILDWTVTHSAELWAVVEVAFALAASMQTVRVSTTWTAAQRCPRFTDRVINSAT